MEEEAEKLKEMQQQVDQMVKSPKTGGMHSSLSVENNLSTTIRRGLICLQSSG